MTTLITGATRGIGRALQTALSASGEETFGTYRGTPPGQIGWLPLDLTQRGAAAGLAKAFGDRPLDTLICNAGIYADKGQSLDTGYPAAFWAETFAVNVTGVFQTIQALLPNLRTGHGKIAIISSRMASDELAPGGSYIYRASKAAVLNLGRNLARDLAADGIAVGIYHPGWVRTDMGGSGADVDADDAARGLIARIEALSAATTGVFEDWQGTAIPF
jgi:NAD(P)-dependent dehydrogenase (short-subunit alcohol dehydrogenase family)